MSSNTEIATSKVLLDGKQAEDQLKQLKKLAQETRKEYEKMKLDKDPEAAKKLKEAQDLEKQVKDLDQSYYSLDKVLKNMNGSSLKDLQKAQRELNAEIRKQARNTDEDRAALKILQDQYVKVGNEIDSVKGSMKKMESAAGSSGNSFKNIAGKIGQFAAGLGLATGAMEIVKGVIFATDAVSDKFEETIGGLKTGLSYLARSIATLDFSNFLNNMSSAITAGRDYVKTLDNIGDRTRAIGIIESKDRERLADLLIIRKDVTKTDKERIEAGKEILNIEQNNAERRKSLAKDQLDNELNYASKMTGLSKERIGQLLVEQETNKTLVEKANEYNLAMDAQRKANSLASGATMYGQTSTPVISKETLNIINSATPAIKKLASELKSFGKLNEDEYNRIAASYENVGEANAYYAESTAKTQVGMAKLLKGQLEEEEQNAKNYVAVIKEAQKTLSQLIAEKDAEIDAAIQSGNIPLAEKSQIEKKAMEELYETYKRVKEAIAQGWDMNQRDQGAIETLVRIGYKPIKGDNTNKSPLSAAKVDNSGHDTSDDIQINEDEAKQKIAEIKDASVQLATDLNNAIFSMVTNHQQAEFNQKMSMLDEQKEKELSNINLTAAQKDAINKKYEARSRALKAEQFENEQKAAVSMAIVNGALAVTRTFSTFGWPAGIIPAAFQAAATLAQIVVIKSQPVPEFAQGRYNVKGLQTGKQYSQVPYTGPAVTGLYTRPALVGETGAEMIIDAPTTKNLQMNYPEILDAIQNARMQQYAGGRFFKNMADQGSHLFLGNKTDDKQDDLIKKLHIAVDGLASTVDALQKKGIKATSNWSLFDLEKIQKKKSDIESATEM